MGSSRVESSSFRAAIAALFLAVLVAAPVSAVKRRAFVTSVSGTGNLASWPGATGATALDKADSICRALAAAADPAPLPNASTYRAWLSTSTTDAYCHVQGLSGRKNDDCNGAPQPGAGPWYLANGITNFSAGLDDLMTPSGEVYRSVSRDENFDPIPGTWSERRYWTGTSASGEGIGTHCSNWTTSAAASSGQTGDAHGAAVLWSYRFAEDCDQPMRLLCLEPGASETPTLGWSPGAIVFVTSASGSGNLSEWPEAEGFSGVSAGYRICRNRAEAAHLPSPASFVPWLSTTAVDARDRVTADGPFKRIDAYTVANDFADLVDGSLDTGIYVTEDGAYLTTLSQGLVWTGTGGDGTFGGQNCDNWTDGTDGDFARAGRAGYSGVSEWTNDNGYFCSIERRLYCISNVITLFWDGFELTGDASRWSDVSP